MIIINNKRYRYLKNPGDKIIINHKRITWSKKLDKYVVYDTIKKRHLYMSDDYKKAVYYAVNSR